MKVLVTGATGFVGRNFIPKILEQGWEVKCLVRRKDLPSYLNDKNIEVIHADLVDEASLKGTIKNIDTVYHLAGSVHTLRCKDMYLGNVVAAENLLKECKNSKIKKFIYLSSIAVYRPSSTRSLLSEESPCLPITYYGKTKLMVEKKIIKYSKKYNFPYVILRTPVIYGPYQHKTLNDFVTKIVLGKNISIIGDGNNLRSICSVENLINVLLSLPFNQKGDNKVYNISDQENYTLKEFIESVAQCAERTIKIKSLLPFLGNISWHIYRLMENIFGISLVKLYALKIMTINLGCDITRAKKDLGYLPPENSDIFIKAMVDWIKNQNAKK